ncbi:hypothetical protein N7456_004916 [Penicillium angulare]|uniref:FAD/NAD(P)-binding domain-containing protein n=1 Tax=Penicillium angulare TaxID=116970 RepID=A0A9W9KJM9_9EURO|nr:hypothetical protein N7456_004916 [Penicillium angulare]
MATYQNVHRQTVDLPRGYSSHTPYTNLRNPKVVIVGCSYAGMSAALTLVALKGDGQIPFASWGDYAHLKMAPSAKDFDITMVDERDGFFHSVGAPLAHISPEKTKVMWKLYEGFSELKRPDIDFVQGTVTSIDSENQMIIYQAPEGKSQPLNYDYVVISSGLQRPWPVVPRAKQLTSYLTDASTFTQRITEAQKLGVVVIGGGAVGVEFAGKIRAHHPETPVTLVHSRDQLLSKEPLPEEFKLRTLQLLRQQGVNVILNQRADVEELPDGTHHVKFNDGDRLHTSMVIMAMASSTPSSQFLPSSVLDSTGSIKVDSKYVLISKVLRMRSDADVQMYPHSLRVINELGPLPRLFAAGDITNIPGIKLGRTAMLMGSVAAANIYSLLVAQNNPSWSLAMEPYIQIKPKMAISVGDSAVCYSSVDGGVQFGKGLVKPLFGSDLGWSKILAALGLSIHEDAC